VVCLHLVLFDNAGARQGPASRLLASMNICCTKTYQSIQGLILEGYYLLLAIGVTQCTIWNGECLCLW
jgi:hypothetical protein